MVSNIKPLRKLNELSKGIDKQWIWGSISNYFLSCDYLEKINYCIQDLNDEIKYLRDQDRNFPMRVIYIIVLVDWINEAITSLTELLKENLKDKFNYQEDKRVARTREYIKAMRSFVVAHPLNTTRHKKFGFDGDFVCIDIQYPESPLFKIDSREDVWFCIEINGIKPKSYSTDYDFVLKVYSRKIDNNKYYKLVGGRFCDLYTSAKMQIDNLYKLSKYLNKFKKKEVMNCE